LTGDDVMKWEDFYALLEPYKDENHEGKKLIKGEFILELINNLTETNAPINNFPFGTIAKTITIKRNARKILNQGVNLGSFAEFIEDLTSTDYDFYKRLDKFGIKATQENYPDKLAEELEKILIKMADEHEANKAKRGRPTKEESITNEKNLDKELDRRAYDEEVIWFEGVELKRHQVWKIIELQTRLKELKKINSNTNTALYHAEYDRIIYNFFHENRHMVEVCSKHHWEDWVSDYERIKDMVDKDIIIWEWEGIREMDIVEYRKRLIDPAYRANAIVDEVCSKLQSHLNK